MMGLEKLLRGLYGSEPQIDMDAQLARARVPRPMALDFAALADGIKRNNVGTAAIKVTVSADVRGDRAIFQPTGQEFRMTDGKPAEAGAKRRTFSVRDWEEPARTRLELLE